MKKTFEVPQDAFASGQVGSKQWLCENLEYCLRRYQGHEGDGFVIWIYGGWVGLLAFLLFSRNRVPIQKIVNFDIEQADLDTSHFLNENWVWKGKYRTIQQDISKLGFKEIMETHSESEPHVVINTSVEHMDDAHWFESLPPKKMVALQTTNMKHKEHINGCDSLVELKKVYPITDSLYNGELFFDYKNENSFTRFMNIGFR